VANDPDAAKRARARRAAVEAAGVLAVLGACVAPHLARLGHPSLYADDLIRVATVRTQGVGRTLFLPFNEHVAPLFDLLSRGAWRLAGSRLDGAAGAYTGAAFAALPIALALLWGIVRRATGSAAAGLGALAVAGGTALYVEAVAWYSGSSFLWALAATLLAFEAASWRGPLGRAVAALGAASAPAFSAIGLLAGPLAACRALAEGEGEGRGRWLGALAPMLGLAAYLGVCRLARVDDVVGESVRRNLALGPALGATLRAPATVLLGDLVGLRGDAPRPARPAEMALGAALLLGMAAWARRSRRARPLALGALGLIVGGYAATFGVRAGQSGGWVLRVERYHLFPQFGLALAAGAGIAALPRRAGWALAIALAVALPAFHAREVVARGRAYRFPDQPALLVAVERVESAARRAGVTRAQAVAAIGPARPGWIDLGIFDLTVLIGPLAEAPRLGDARARAVVIGALTPEQRATLRRVGGLP
jgi:hypothetical protein